MKEQWLVQLNIDPTEEKNPSFVSQPCFFFQYQATN